MLERWRYHGRHRGKRGCFPDYYRSVEALAAAQQITVELIELLDRDIAANIEIMQANYLRIFLHRGEPEPAIGWPLWSPPDGNTPTLVFDTEPRDRSGVVIDPVRGLIPHWLWLPGDELDDDEQAVLERLMAMAGA